MERFTDYLYKVKHVIALNEETDIMLDKLSGIDYKGDKDINLPVLSTAFLYCMGELKCNWLEKEDDNYEDIGRDLSIIKQIISDFEAENDYKQTFFIECVYSKLLPNNEYLVDKIRHELSALTVAEAKKLTDAYRKDTPKKSLKNPELSLDDVSLNIRIIDQNDEEVISYSIVPEHGIYFSN